MNTDIVLVLKKFCADIMETNQLPEPAKIELLDVGMNSVFEMEAHKDDHGTWVFPIVRPLSQSLVPSGGFAVRFSYGIPMKSFTKDFPA